MLAVCNLSLRIDSSLQKAQSRSSAEPTRHGIDLPDQDIKGSFEACSTDFQALRASCANCGTMPSRVAAKFCDECGAQLRQIPRSRSPTEKGLKDAGEAVELVRVIFGGVSFDVCEA